ncbi:hypothetical protein, conserved [Trypanosoma brucei gambiense DAL972]|uniref:Vesicle transport v-SNARE N-terminal domain-containing protein n=1 Tax=Trypanosoma brucei gambiense (strain MHOM/CI/86/DAL972) TaxID=679716 RepID=C9ZTX8_TRYB9|nr:hypothetical protein, conserved [Trypanosoma brucei gambiense DAL972]CBH12864.1 hypothetical protein, conserved [Trypanosoma brucei gambiense DAL972]|eukprot:XP_011775143.1 hypothetical protein, conserved [Trypanosoma brucei gambiense DAL972]
MSNAEAYDKKLKMLEVKAQGLLRDLKTTADPIRRLRCHTEAQNTLNEIQQNYQLLKTEIQLLEGDEGKLYKNAEQEHAHELSNLKRMLQLEKAPVPVVPGDQSSSMFGALPATGDRREEARRIAQSVVTIQGTTLGSLAQAERALHDTEEVSVNATTRLIAQTEQIRNIRDRVEDLDSEVTRARKELNEFIHRMATDKIIICFYTLIMIGIIIFATLKFLQK